MSGSTSVPPMTPLELACGLVFGRADVPPLALPLTDTSPRAALEEVVRGALEHPPCVVSFSGGRDSSAVLAVAAHVARRDGLALPVPVTLTFRNDPGSVEDEWQRMVIDALALTDWQRLEMDDGMDVIGTLAAQSLRRHGPQWPFNAYFHLPVLRAAAGGSVLTGIGGDELFGSGLWHRENLVLSGRARPMPLDAARLALAAAPRSLRRPYFERRLGAEQSPRTWLLPSAQLAAHRERIEQAAREPFSLRGAIMHSLWPARSRVLGQQSLAALAADTGTRCISPLTSAPVLGAVARTRGWRDFDGRGAAMAQLFGDLLPAALTARVSKAGFAAAFFTERARTFARQWDGRGLEHIPVDPIELRRQWTRAEAPPDARSFALLQTAWLAAGAPDVLS